MQVGRAASAAVLVLALVAAGCSSDGSDGGKPSGGDAPAVEIDAHGGTGQIWMRTEPGTELELVDADGKVVPIQDRKSVV